MKTKSASFWAVRFETNNGNYHPLFFGTYGGPKIALTVVRKEAKLYLKEHSSWLKCIDEIYAPDE